MDKEVINSISDKEREAVIALTKYFSNFWTIVDVGSNKGQWSDILMDVRNSSNKENDYRVYFFEPNKLLLDYCKVKYDFNNKILYYDNALGSKFGHVENFYYFEDNHSGISNFLGNWKELNPKEVGVFVYTMDRFVIEKEIDIVKIDVEGWELEVLKGAENLLKDKKIKFLQVECSPHNKDYKFQDIVQCLGQFGYKCWDYKDEEFVEISQFPEDTIDNFYFTYLPIGKYHYTQLWNNDFIKNTEFLKKKIEFAIELGSFEGITSNYICDELLTEGSRMIAVDHLEDYYLKEGSDEATNSMFVGQHERFIRNTVHKPIELIRKKTQDIKEDIKNYWFDFCFIDANHLPEAVYNDAVLIFPRMKIGGHILFDDYNWEFQGQKTKDGIDKFLNEYKWTYELILKDTQVIIKKTAHVS